MLKKDFLNLYLSENYCHDGLNEEDRELAAKGELVMEDNTESFKVYYRFLERQIYHPPEDVDRSQNDIDFDKEIIDFFQKKEDQPVIEFLLNKLLIFSCHKEETREEFIKYFEFMCKHGDKWLEEHKN